MHNGMGMPMGMGMGMPMPSYPGYPMSGGHMALPPHPSPVISSSASPAQHGRPVQQHQHQSMNQPHSYPRQAQQAQPARQNPPAQQSQARPANAAQPAPAQQPRQQNSPPTQPPSSGQPRQVNQAQPGQAQTRQVNSLQQQQQQQQQQQPARTNNAAQPQPQRTAAAAQPPRPANGVNAQQKQQQPAPQQKPNTKGQPSTQNPVPQQPRQAVSQTPRPAPPKNNGFITELWVVRHGETPENKTRTIAGQNASGLTPMGVKQAGKLAERLRGMRFHSIFLSDLNRTKQTADPVLKALPSGIPAFTDTRLREKGAGQYEGFKIGYIEQMTRYSGMPHRLFRPPGGESWEDVAARSRSFMKDVLERHCVLTNEGVNDLRRVAREHREKIGQGDQPPSEEDDVKKVLIITHGGFISEFLSSAVGGIPNSSKNCSLSILGIKMMHPRSPPHFWLKLSNDIEHLSAIGAPVPAPNVHPPTRTTPQPQSTPDFTGILLPPTKAAGRDSPLVPAGESAEPMRAEGYEADGWIPPQEGYQDDPATDDTGDTPNGAEGGGAVDTDSEGAMERPLGHEASQVGAAGAAGESESESEAAAKAAAEAEEASRKASVHVNGGAGASPASPAGEVKKDAGESPGTRLGGLRDAVQC